MTPSQRAFFLPALSIATIIGLMALPAIADKQDALDAASKPALHQPKKSDVQMAYVKANYAMHDAMKVALTGDADIDFAKSMVPHHEGAVEMAKIVLEHGHDPKMRALAESVIRVQEAEIAFFKEWLKENPKEET